MNIETAAGALASTWVHTRFDNLMEYGCIEVVWGLKNGKIFGSSFVLIGFAIWRTVPFFKSELPVFGQINVSRLALL